MPDPSDSSPPGQSGPKATDSYRPIEGDETEGYDYFSKSFPGFERLPISPPYEDNDTLRKWAALAAGLSGIGGFAYLACWAMNSVSMALKPETLTSPNLPAVLAAKTVVVLSVGAFCYFLLALAERLLTPQPLLLQMAELKARRKEQPQGLTTKAMDELLGFAKKLSGFLRPESDK